MRQFFTYVDLVLRCKNYSFDILLTVVRLVCAEGGREQNKGKVDNL